MSDLIDRQAAITAICNACGKIDCDKMDKCDKLQLPSTNTSGTPNSSDTISRKAAIDLLKQMRKDGNMIPWEGKDVFARIRKLPPAQPERIKGRWIYTGVKFPNWEGQIVSEAFCSECNGISYFRRALDKWIGANFCPNCGAKMDGEVKA